MRKRCSRFLELWVPLTYEAFVEYRLGAINLSRSGLAVVKRMIGGEQITQASSGLSAREWQELAASLDLTSA